MALSRCKENHSNPKGKKGNQYVTSKEPIGYPASSTICGRVGCENPGVVWLTKEEEQAYKKGKRVFSYKSHVSKVKVK